MTIFGSDPSQVAMAKSQVEQIVTQDDAGSGGVSHSVECPQVSSILKEHFPVCLQWYLV